MCNPSTSSAWLQSVAETQKMPPQKQNYSTKFKSQLTTTQTLLYDINVKCCLDLDTVAYQLLRPNRGNHMLLSTSIS
jgi:hypothetical protein